MFWILVVVTLGNPPNADPKSMIERPERYATKEMCERAGREVERAAGGLAFTICKSERPAADKQALR